MFDVCLEIPCHLGVWKSMVSMGLKENPRESNSTPAKMEPYDCVLSILKTLWGWQGHLYYLSICFNDTQTSKIKKGILVWSRDPEKGGFSADLEDSL